MKVNIRIKEGFQDLELPEYKTSGSAAVDLRAAISGDVVLKVGESKLIPSGLFADIPEGYMMHITPRSGFALKSGISIVNSPGIIDSDYRGEIGIILINHGKFDFTVHRGDRIAQMSFLKVEQAEFEIVDELSETKRGEGGFGHTGHE